MKIIKYNLCVPVSQDTGEEPQTGEILTSVVMDWSEANEEIAKREAWNGEYTVDDDGRPQAAPTQQERIGELEQALDMILSGVTE